jgi:hypothetical protein
MAQIRFLLLQMVLFQMQTEHLHWPPLRQTCKHLIHLEHGQSRLVIIRNIKSKFGLLVDRAAEARAVFLVAAAVAADIGNGRV